MADFGIGFTASDPTPVITAIRRDLAGKMRRAINVAGRATLAETREDTRKAFPGHWANLKTPTTRLANTWRGRLYPQDSASETLEPAFLVYSKAPEIIAAHEAGLTIVPNRGVYLAYPTIESARYDRRPYARQLRPEVWRRENRVPLRFIPTPYGGVLVADLQRFKRNRKRKGKPDTFVVDRPYGAQVMFVLIRRANLSKRLHVAEIAQRAGGLYRLSLGAELARS
jgi:hypothetical protein